MLVEAGGGAEYKRLIAIHQDFSFAFDVLR